MKEIKQLYLEGGYLEVGGVTFMFLMLFVALLCFIVFLIIDLTKIDFKYKFSKKGIVEFKQNFKNFIIDWIPIMLMVIGLITIFLGITFVIGFVVKLFI